MNEIIKNLSFKDYTERDGINNSSFGSIDPERDGCPAIWNASQGIKNESSSPALFFGRVFHKFILEFDDFWNDYVLLDNELKDKLFNQALAEGSKAKKFSKSLSTYRKYAEKIKARGKEFIDEDLLKTLNSMRKSVGRQIEPYDDVILGSDKETELSVFADLHDFKGNKLQCKGRIDAIKPGKKIVDLKTTISGSPYHLARHIPKMKLYVQAAFYMDLMKANDAEVGEFYWCFVDKRPPYPCTYIECDSGMLKLGRHEYRTWLGWISDGYSTGNWPGHLRFIDWPNYFMEQIETL